MKKLVPALILIVATAFGFPASAQTPVRVGVLKLSSSAPVFVAYDKGYFKGEGLDVALKFFDAAQPVAVAAASGDIDIGVTAFTAGLFNVAGKGAVTVVAGQSREQPGYPLIGYFATAKAYAGGLTKPTDLAGKRIAITQAGSSFHYSLGLLADKDHFALSGVHLVPLQSLSNIAAALKGGQVDGALLPVTTALPLMASGDIKLLGWVGNETPWQLGAVFVSKGEMQHRDIVAKFLAAYRLGARDYHDILLASIKDGRAQIDDKTRPLIDSIVRYTHLKPEQVVVGLSYIDRDGMLDVPGVAKQLVWFQANHFVDDGFGVQQVVDESFGFAR
ncbi:MAG TPA: ABC transporter substrate-binding protein [Stellaceae bacterium]|jgi:NitT/TauT family transport system substrate-binding protein